MSTGIFSFECLNLPWLFGFVLSLSQHPLSSTLNIVRPFLNLVRSAAQFFSFLYHTAIQNAIIQMPLQCTKVKQHSTPIKTCQKTNLNRFGNGRARKPRQLSQSYESTLRWSHNILWVLMKCPPVLSQKIECHNLAMVWKNTHTTNISILPSVSFTQTAQLCRNSFRVGHCSKLHNRFGQIY
jgi:hypothetical protein